MNGPVEIARLEVSDDELATWLGAVAEALPPSGEAADSPRPVLFLEGPVEVALEALTERVPIGGTLRTARRVRVFTPAWELYGRRAAAAPAGAGGAGSSGRTDGQDDERLWLLRGVGPADDLVRLGRLVPGPDHEPAGDEDGWIERKPLDEGSSPDTGSSSRARHEKVLLAGQYAPDDDGWWEGTYGRSLQYPVAGVKAQGGTDEPSKPPRRLALETVRHRHEGVVFWRWCQLVAGSAPESEAGADSGG